MELDLSAGPSLEGIAIVNIPSIYGGANLWGETDKKKRRSRGDSVSSDLSVAVQGKRTLLIVLPSIQAQQRNVIK